MYPVPVCYLPVIRYGAVLHLAVFFCRSDESRHNRDANTNPLQRHPRSVHDVNNLFTCKWDSWLGGGRRSDWDRITFIIMREGASAALIWGGHAEDDAVGRGFPFSRADETSTSSNQRYWPSVWTHGGGVDSVHCSLLTQKAWVDGQQHVCLLIDSADIDLQVIIIAPCDDTLYLSSVNIISGWGQHVCH